MWLEFEWKGSVPGRGGNCLQKLCYKMNDNCVGIFVSELTINIFLV